MRRKIKSNTRDSKKRNTNPIIVIVCDAKETEPVYFKNFKARNKPLEVAVVDKAAGKSFDELIQETLRAKDKYIAGTESSSSLWLVADVDVNRHTKNNEQVRQNQIEKLKKDAAFQGFKVVLSNPCFELWFLLHFSYSTGYLSDYNGVLQKLLKHIPEYKKTTDVFTMLENEMTKAILNGKKLKKHHEGLGVTLKDVKMNPYTDVFELVEELTK